MNGDLIVDLESIQSKFGCYSNSLFQGLQLLLLLDPNFHFIAGSKLVLEVLARAKAPESTSSHHDAHFGRECLGFLHRVSCEYHSTLFVLLTDLGND